MSDVSSIIADIPAPGSGIIASAVNFISGLVKGKTQHPDYQAGLASAGNWAKTVVDAFSDFNSEELAVIRQKIYPRFLSGMQQYWGLGANMSAQIAKMFQAPPFVDLQTYAWLFYEWVWTNIDANQPQSFATYMNTLYPAVFVGAVQDAGLDVNRIKGVSVTTGGGTGTTGSAVNSKMAGIIVVVLLLGALILLGRKKS